MTDYDFSGLCGDQIEVLEKRLESLKKKFIKEYKVALNVINNPTQHKNRPEMMVEIDDTLQDVANKITIFYTEALNKVQRVLGQYL